MKKIEIGICSLIALYCWSSASFAGITFLVQADKATYIAGETATMSLFAYAPGVNADTFLQAFQLAYDLKPLDGKGYDQVSFSNEQAFFGGTNGVYSPAAPQFTKNDASFSNFDFRVRGERTPDHPDINLNGRSSTNAIKLATIKFDIAVSTAPGAYSFVFKPGATLTNSSPVNSVTVDGIILGEADLSFDAEGGAFNVEAVPEPTTVSLVVIGLVGGIACRRYRRRSSAIGQEIVGGVTPKIKM